MTVSCAEGDDGPRLRRQRAFRDDPCGHWRRSSGRAPPIMVNLGNPDLAFRTAMLPNDGVGLARMEFIINEHIGIHPMALAQSGRRSTSGRAREQIATADSQPRHARPTSSSRSLRKALGTIAAAFYPKPVIVRLSDFKTNEYASLLGGAGFEPKEENPMLGFPRRLALLRIPPMRPGSRSNAPRCAASARTWA